MLALRSGMQKKGQNARARSTHIINRSVVTHTKPIGMGPVDDGWTGVTRHPQSEKMSSSIAVQYRVLQKVFTVTSLVQSDQSSSGRMLPVV